MASGASAGISAHRKPQDIAFYLGCAIIAVLFALNLVYHEPVDEAFLSEYDQFDSYEQVNADPVVFKVAKEGNEVGYLVLTKHYGYQSDVEIASLVSTDGTLIEARTYRQDETPSYYQKLVAGSFFKRNFTDKPIEDGFDISLNVDAISHATISSNAATKAIQQGVSYVGEHYVNTPVAKQGGAPTVGYLDIFVILMLIIAFVASRFSKTAWIKWVARVYSMVVMGFIAAQFITLSVLVAFFSLQWPDVVDYLRWYLLVFGVLVLILGTGKNLYCNYMCPFGAFQELEFALGGPLGSKPLNPRVTKIMRWFPGALIFVSLALTLWFHNLGFTSYEPFSLLFGQVGVGIQWALLPIILVGALFSRRIYCTFICPIGYVLGKIVKLRTKVASRLKKGSATPKAIASETAADAVAKSAEEAPAPTEEPMRDEAEATQETAEGEDATTAGEETKPEPAKAKAPAKKGPKPMTGRDWFILAIGCALAVVSLLSIFNGFGPA